MIIIRFFPRQTSERLNLIEMTTRIVSLFVLCAVMCQTCLAKPAKVLQNPESLSPVQQEEAISTVSDNKREQRSPQFGFLNGDYSDSDLDFEEGERSFKHHYKHHHKPAGCRDYPCGQYPGYVPPVYPSYPTQGGTSGSFATASAGSINANGPTGGQSHSNAQSASFNFGPYSASFSVAESSSGQKF
ncbi:uncharacterized protein LOC117230160 [Bombus vosnesenskii]|uniref:Uncharacterized protein LOC117230160 n=1 Tax=Bombus vosnesenskii TaxID=207650 RepID=A0A6J3JQX5_9HYME|nr:uncharacterized protein LOC117230160 [Bombus vosnesenskii]